MRILLVSLALLLAACGESGSGLASVPPSSGASSGAGSSSGGTTPASFKVLVFSRTVGFRHASIPVGIQAIQSLGTANNFSVDASEDPTVFTPANLAQYRVIVFLNTTLNVLDTDAQQAALEGYMQAGGGYVGVHSAADTEHDWPYYGELVGAYFRTHPVQQLGTIRREATDHPSTAHLADSTSLFDEFYSFSSNPRGKVRVLLNIDEASYQQNPNTSCLPDSPTIPNGYNGRMVDHPLSWCHTRKGGVAWYTALGHEVALYQQPEFRNHLLGGILTAAGRIASDCTPRETSAPNQPDPDLKMCPVL